MGTRMAPSYANLFLAKFESDATGFYLNKNIFRIFELSCFL